jgi:hypothetical protein
MRINEIAGKIFFPEDYDKEKAKKVRPNKDKLEISEEARGLFEAKRGEKIQTIKERINSRFYESREILEKVADKILSIIRKK